MVLMAGMLDGARRRRLRPAGAGASSLEAPPCVGTRRPSFCLHAAAAGSGHASVTGGSKTAWPWTKLESNAREAKERLDRKLRSQRESVVQRHHGAGSLRVIPAARNSNGEVRKDVTAAAASVLQREVFNKEGGGGRRFSWGSRARRKASPELQQAECAVCLEEFRAGESLACLPCAHRFHWACAVPWIQASSRCPFCRAAVHLPELA